jgi:hypothetical protein
MVHEKKKSGDPDFDDKVPAGEHLTVVRAGDGTIVGRMDPALGPVTPEGQHLPAVDPEELDTRPAPGEVAEEKATVQTYTAEDVPREEISLEEAFAPAEDASQRNSGDAVAAENAAAQAPAPKPVAPKKASTGK